MQVLLWQAVCLFEADAPLTVLLRFTIGLQWKPSLSADSHRDGFIIIATF